MSNPMNELDGGAVQLEEANDPATGAQPSAPDTDNSPRLDAPPEESTSPTDEDPDKENVGASTPDET